MTEKNKKVVTRLAPSPTSPYGLHVGNIRTMLFSYIFAKQNDGIFYLRIEDTDQDRFCEGSEEQIKKTLDWLGIVPDFSPWSNDKPFGTMRQSERDYSEHVQFLLDNGFAYYAFDTKEELNALRMEAEINKQNFSYNYSNRMYLNNSLSLSKESVKELLDNNTPYVIRFKVIPDQIIKFIDIVKGEMTFNSNEMDDKVLIKTNKIASYHLANCCDDHNMGTTHTIRGEEWVSSTPLHIMLYNAFGWDYPIFAHLPSVLNPAPLPGKLSKRNAVKLGIPIFPFGGPGVDDKGVKFELKGLVEEGYDPAAFINFLLLLGWTHPEGNEIISLQEAIDSFDLHKVHNHGARYDIDKLKYFNGWYLQNKVSNDELFTHVNFGDTHYNEDEKLAILDMAKKRSHFKKDMQHVVDIFTKPVVLDDKQLKSISEVQMDTLLAFLNIITLDLTGTKMMVYSDIEDNEWTPEYVKECVEKACVKTGLKAGKIMPVLRTILAGGTTGPDMFTFMNIIKRQETFQRISEVALNTDELNMDEHVNKIKC